MARRPVRIKIKPQDLARIGQLLGRGVQQVRVVLRALALRQLGAGVAAPRVAESLPLTAKAIRQIAPGAARVPQRSRHESGYSRHQRGPELPAGAGRRQHWLLARDHLRRAATSSCATTAAMAVPSLRRSTTMAPGKKAAKGPHDGVYTPLMGAGELGLVRSTTYRHPSMKTRDLSENDFAV